MEPHIKKIIDSVEPFDDSRYGLLYRCALTLKDGTEIPCAILQSKQKIIEHAQCRIEEEMAGGHASRFEQVFASFVTGGNQLNDYDVIDARPSEFAPPLSLLKQIHGETFMSWTGWVFEMSDGQLFAYGSSYLMEFFHLPNGYTFDDVAHVHNHSYLNPEGKLMPLKWGGSPPDDYDPSIVYRERVYFRCAIDGI